MGGSWIPKVVVVKAYKPMIGILITIIALGASADEAPESGDG